MEETSRGCGAGGASRNKRKPAAELPEGGEGGRGSAQRRAAGRAGSCLRRWGRGRQPGPCPPLSRGHHDQRDPEEELQQAGPAEPHQVRAHLPAAGPGSGWLLPAGARLRPRVACWGYRGEERKFVPDRPSSCPFKSAEFLPHPGSSADAMRWKEGK